jgi:hypothetical protein
MLKIETIKENNRKPTRKPIEPTKSQFKRIKEIFTIWSHTSDINCYTKIFMYQGNFLVQLIWTLILLGSTCATCWLITKSVLDYLAYEVVSQTNVFYEVPTKFPAITVCDNDPFTSKYSENLYENISKTNNFGWNPINNVNNNLNFLVKMHAANPSFGDENRKLLGFDIKSIMNCRYNQIKCGEELHWYYSFDYGNCWQFNSGFNSSNHKVPIKDAKLDDKDFGFSMTVYPLISQNKYMTTWDQGMIVFVHNSSFRPVSADGIYVKPGEQSLISIKRTLTQKYPHPYSECFDLTTYSSELYDFILKSNQTYRQIDCFKLCIQKEVIKNCGCFYLSDLNLVEGTRPCLSLNESLCAQKYSVEFNIKECQLNYCPLECESFKYELTLSSLINPHLKEFFSFNQKDLAKYESEIGVKNLTYDIFKSTWVNIRVFYPSLQYTRVSELPKTSIIDLFTQIGGSLSMFVSFSLFTLFEFLEIILLILNSMIFKTSNVAPVVWGHEEFHS